jgi:hypothetical protein
VKAVFEKLTSVLMPNSNVFPNIDAEYWSIAKYRCRKSRRYVVLAEVFFEEY